MLLQSPEQPLIILTTGLADIEHRIVFVVENVDADLIAKIDLL